MNQLNLIKMGSDDFKGFISLRQVYNALAPYRDRGVFEAGDNRHVLEAAEQEEIVGRLGKLGNVREMAELISAADIGATTDVLDRQIIAAYRSFMAEPDMDLAQLFVKRPVDDFVFRSILFSDLENYSPKKDHEGYDAAYIDIGSQDNELEMWGKLIHASWKAWRSNRGEILRTLPTQLGVAGKRTLHRIYAGLLGTQNAAWQAMYNTTNGNLFTLALTQPNLEYVITQMLLMTDPINGEPRGTKMATLVVPATLKPTADRIINPVLDSLALQSIANNWRPINLKVIGNPMLDRYTTEGWWLFAQPIGNQGPVVDAYLNGNEAPEIFIKASDAQRISGGGGEELGSFRTENISWKGRLSRKPYFLPDLYWMTAYSEPAS